MVSDEARTPSESSDGRSRRRRYSRSHYGHRDSAANGSEPLPPMFPQNFLGGVCKILAHEITTPNSTADVLAKTLRRPHCGPYPPSEPRDRPVVPPRREARPPKPVSGFPDGKVPMKLALHRSPRMDVPGAADIAVNTTTIATKIGLVRRLPYGAILARPPLSPQKKLRGPRGGPDDE